MVHEAPVAAVVVDPYSSGRYLLYELQARDVPIICVRSSLKLGDFFLSAYDKNAAYFTHTLDYKDDLPALVAALKALPFRVAAVFPGCEPGVSLADALADALALPNANGLELAKARKDKAEMQEQLRRCGVPACEQFLSGDLDELLGWADRHGRWPLVMKPCCSSGSDGIYFCKSQEDLLDAHAAVVGTVTPNATVNSQVVLQEFLDGTEYIVDTVSHAGRHLCVAIWVYSKRRGTAWNPHCILSEGNRLLPASGAVQDILVEYVFRVLDAVGMKYGPCHTEVMMVERGPILVEVNARLHGLQGPQLIGLATGTSQATYAVDALLSDGELFKSRYVPGPDRYLYPMQRECLQMVLINSQPGFLTRGIANALYNLKLPSVVKVLPAAQKGQWLPASVDLNTTAGCALLLHESAEQLDADRARIREEEDSGLYEVSLEPLSGGGLPSPSASPALLPQPPAKRYQAISGASPMAAPALPIVPSIPSQLSLGSMGAMSGAATPMLHSMERCEEVWAAVHGFTLEPEPGLEEPLDRLDNLPA